MIQANIDESIFSVNRHISTIKRLKKIHKKPYSYLTHDTKLGNKPTSSLVAQHKQKECTPAASP